jgi:4-hydroxy-tetrahydrodipicolinate synthase
MQSIGGSGVISVLANAIPSTFKTLIEGDETASLQAAFLVLKLNGLMYEEGNPVGIKNLLLHQGIIQTDQVRLPLLRASQGLSDKIHLAKPH